MTKKEALILLNKKLNDKNKSKEQRALSIVLTMAGEYFINSK